MVRLAVRAYGVVVVLGAPMTLVVAFGRSWLLSAGVLVVALPQWSAVVVVVVLRWIDPPTTAFIRRVSKALHPAGEQVECTWVAYDALSPELRLAVIAGEDVCFARHAGFDWESLRAARAHNKVAGGRRRGGSTISQQVAKNLFLWSGRSYVRKAIEAYFTLLIESVWGKHRILEMYLNVAQFGPRTFGAEAAARRFFGKPALALTRSESALLVAVLPDPARRAVDQPDRTVRYRQLLIRGSMDKLGVGYMARFDGSREDRSR